MTSSDRCVALLSGMERTRGPHSNELGGVDSCLRRRMGRSRRRPAAQADREGKHAHGCEQQGARCCVWRKCDMPAGHETGRRNRGIGVGNYRSNIGRRHLAAGALLTDGCMVGDESESNQERVTGPLLGRDVTATVPASCSQWLGNEQRQDEHHLDDDVCQARPDSHTSAPITRHGRHVGRR